MSSTTAPKAERSRIIPSVYRSAEITLTGEAPLLMHKDTLLDFTHPITRDFTALTGKSSKARTADDRMMIAKLEWLAGIYHDEQLGPYIPNTMLHGALAGAATRWRKGSTVQRSLVVLDRQIRLEYDGPRGLEELWEAGFSDMRGAVNSAGFGRGGRVTRTRPMFEEWALTARVAYDPKELDTSLLEDVLEFAQIRGIGDFRPTFGTFSGTWTEVSS